MDDGDDEDEDDDRVSGSLCTVVLLHVQKKYLIFLQLEKQIFLCFSEKILNQNRCLHFRPLRRANDSCCDVLLCLLNYICSYLLSE